MRPHLVVAAALLAAATMAHAAGPEPAEPATAIAPPQDIPYPGTIKLAVDATDLDRRIFKVHETVPVAAGALTLLYPQWLPGDHAPDGPLHLFAGLIIHAGGQRLEWTRDPVDMFAFHVDVPSGTSTIELDFQYLSAVAKDEERVEITQDMLNLEWNQVVLYPAGYFSRQIAVEPSITLPKGWRYGTALEPASAHGDDTIFKTVTLNNLVDSPMFAGRYFAQIDLDPGGKVPVHLDVVADRPDLLAMKPEQIAAHKALVTQAYKLFGAHHYAHYDLLLALSDKLSGQGLEHHQSSENATIPNYFSEWDKTPSGRDLLAHEFTHSWNGKFRRPADLWTPNFNVPMRNSLLWVYEGQTEYWGYVLAARAGLFTKQEALDAIAGIAATYDHRVGREWRALEDTTNDPIIADRRAIPWKNWQRSEDYYDEGLLNWLDIDTLIRKDSGGQHALDDFAKSFFGIDDGSYVTVTYQFDDVVKTLNQVQPEDWASLLKSRLFGHAAGAPLDGLTRGGYRLVYTETQSDYQASEETETKDIDLKFSIGVVIDEDGSLTEVQWNGPAFKAGLNVGAKLVAINGESYDDELLKDMITNAKHDEAPLKFLIKQDGRYRTLDVDYHEGLRYPHLERIPETPALLDQILAPKG